MSVPKDYEENTPLEEQSLINFLTDLSLVADIDEADTQNGVTLMTMHSAKGLEFPIVLLWEWRVVVPHIRAIKVKMIMKWKRTSYLLCIHEQKSCFISQMQRPECCLVVLNPICHLDFKRNPRTYLIVIPVKKTNYISQIST